MSPDRLERALRQAYTLGQTYWQQADSESYSQNIKSEVTRQKFATLVAETIDAHLSEPQTAAEKVPGGCTPADARVLREANHALAIENHALRDALLMLLNHCSVAGWWMQTHAITVMNKARDALKTGDKP